MVSNLSSSANLRGAAASALSGVKLSEKQTTNVSNNMSNAYVEGYSRKKITFSTRTLNEIGSGVKIDNLIRVTSEAKVGVLRETSSQYYRLDVETEYGREIDALQGKPGERGSLNDYLTTFQKSVSNLTVSPNSTQARSNILREGAQLAEKIRDTADSIQDLRQRADKKIELLVNQVNAKLTALHDINIDIRASGARGESLQELLDKRDIQLQELSELMDFRAQIGSDDTVMIFISGQGAILSSTVSQLSYASTNGIDATISYSDGDIAGILIDGDPAKDITTTITGGKLAGLIAMRDTHLPDTQASLDEFTAQFRDQMNAIHNRGTPPKPPATLISQRGGFTAGTDPFTGTGNVRIAVVDRTTGQFVDSTVPGTIDAMTLDLSTLTDLDSLVTAVNGGMDYVTANYNAVTNQFEMTINGTAPPGSDYGIALVSMSDPEATESVSGAGLGFSHYFGFHDMFETVVSGVRANHGNTPGIANNITLAPTLQNKEALITAGTLSASTVPVAGDWAITPGDANNVQALSNGLVSDIVFNMAGLVPARTESLASYVATMTAYTSDKYNEFREKLSNKGESLTSTKEALEAIRGVDLQEEIINLMRWQKLHRVCSKAITTIDEMMETLINIKR